jgi:hypothetical protein
MTAPFIVCVLVAVVTVLLAAGLAVVFALDLVRHELERRQK